MRTPRRMVAVTAANTAGGGSLQLRPGCAYTLTQPQPNTDSGLPPIATPITIDGRGATITGGFIGVHTYGTAQVSDSSITGNTGAWGGGLNNTGGTTTVARTVIRDNVTESDIGVGAGIFNSQGATTTVTASTFNMDDSLVVLNTPTNCEGNPAPVRDCTG